jgi:glucose-6-phosphate isomerase
MPQVIPSRVDNHIERRLSAMRGQFLDQESYQKMLSADDQLIYEVYEIRRPEIEGELLTGISIVHPGKVGKEFFMTKGHFHSVLDTAEVYYCMGGEGFMVMETPSGDTSVEPLSPGKVLYVPPRWAHRSVCTSRLEDLVTFFIYPGNAGHDYGTIERQGFRKLVLDGEHGPEIVDNPRCQ